MTAPFPVPAHRKWRDGAVLASAFTLGAIIGVGVVVHAVGRDLFDRYLGFSRR